MGWASFHVLEVMSSTRMHHKAVGYLAASQSFTPATDVIMLTTNLLKKVRRGVAICSPSHARALVAPGSRRT